MRAACGRHIASAAAVTPRLNIGKGVSGAVRYVFGQGRDPRTGELKSAANDNQSRVEWISGQNFGFRVGDADDAELARRIMEFDALNQRSRTRPCEQDCVHLSLSWKPGENPSRQEMEEAARDALKALGMENAKALFVAHNDETYAHVHIIASKINPATGRAYDLAGSWRTLSRWAEAYELAHGGIISTRRQDMNELRQAIADRDAGAVLEALTKQRSTFTPSQLHRALEKEIYDGKELVAFHREVLARPELIELAAMREGPTVRYTTRAVLEAEHHVLRAAAELAASTHHRIGVIEKIAVRQSPVFAGMTAEQQRAFDHATGGQGLALIDGQAGTGKSYTIAAIRAAYEQAGRDVIGLAPTNAVASDMRADGFRRGATVHSELFALANGRRSWTANTVVIIDEAAMLDTKLMALLTANATAAHAKLILVGDDRQLSSINRGGMFGALKDRYQAAELSEVKRQHKIDDRRAAEMMAEGNFHDALGIYERNGAITWTRTQEEARVALVERWTADTAAAPGKSRFVFAYTNSDVAMLNAALRAIRKERGELGDDHSLHTKHGRADFAVGDRIQFTSTDKAAGVENGRAGTIEAIESGAIKLKLDGKNGARLTIDPSVFQDYRHAYAGTIYRGQGRTLDQTYLYHSEHWRSAASYVALTRHREKAELFVARNTAKDTRTLARQMARTEDKRAAAMFYAKQPIGFIPNLTPAELNAQLSPREAEKLLNAAGAEPVPFGITNRPEDPFTAVQRIHDRLSGSNMLQRVRRMRQRYVDLPHARDPGRDRDEDVERTRRR